MKTPPAKLNFETEALMQNAVAGLLQRMGLLNVRITHGTRELGKDIVFESAGPFGEKMVCACILKNKRITGDAEKSPGARNVMHQVEQAFDSPCIDSDGSESCIQRVYVISAYPITQEAIGSIAGKLRSQLVGNVIFWGGEKLLELIQKFWPEFLLDEFTLLQARFARQVGHASEKEMMALSSCCSLPPPPKETHQIYVSRTLERTIARREVNVDVGEFLMAPLKMVQLASQSGELIVAQSMMVRIVDAIRHSINWGYANEDELHQDYASLVDDYIDSWRSAVNAKFDCNYKDISRVDESLALPMFMAVNRHSGGDEFKRKSQELELKLCCFAEELKRQADACSKLCAEVPTIKQIGVPEWLEAARFDEFLESAPLLSDCFRNCLGYRISFDEADFRRCDSDLLIVGPPGYGKTRFCRHNALVDLEAYQSGSSDVLPCFVPLHVIQHEAFTDFEDSFFRFLGDSILFGQNHKRPKRVRLYLDGLDEVISSDKQARIIRLSVGGKPSDVDVQVIVTARDYVIGPWLNGLARIRLVGWGGEEVRQFANEWFKGDPELADFFISGLGDNAGLNNLMSVPLMATLVISLYRKEKQVPRNKTGLYRQFTELLCGGWDLLKGVLRPQRFGRDVKVILLSRLAFSCHQDGEKYFDLQRFAKTCSQVFKDAARIRVADILEEVLVDGILERSGDTIFFSHLSFQEYFAANHICLQREKHSIVGVVEKVETEGDWWWEVLVFIVGLDKARVINEFNKAKTLFTVSPNLSDRLRAELS